MKKFLEYISILLGFDIAIKRIGNGALKSLPLYIVDSIDIYQTEMWGVNIALLKVKSDDNFTPDQLLRIMEIGQKALNMKVVFVFDTIKAYNRQRLIAKAVNFVALDKQIFIPSLMVDLQDMRKTEPVEIKKPTALAQQIVLYHLQKQLLNGRTNKDISVIFDTTYITANRAIKSLFEFNVIDLTDVKERRIEFRYKGRELWDNVEPMLDSPIAKTLYTDDIIEQSIMAHINALAHYTMINEDLNSQFAVSKDELKKLNLKTDKEFGENRVEVWNYDPKLLSSSDCVDRLSLYLSLRDNSDERVQMEIDSLINEMKWLEE